MLCRWVGNRLWWFVSNSLRGHHLRIAACIHAIQCMDGLGFDVVMSGLTGRECTLRVSDEDDASHAPAAAASGVAMELDVAEWLERNVWDSVGQLPAPFGHDLCNALNESPGVWQKWYEADSLAI